MPTEDYLEIGEFDSYTRQIMLICVVLGKSKERGLLLSLSYIGRDFTLSYQSDQIITDSWAILKHRALIFCKHPDWRRSVYQLSEDGVRWLDPGPVDHSTGQRRQVVMSWPGKLADDMRFDWELALHKLYVRAKEFEKEPRIWKTDTHDGRFRLSDLQQRPIHTVK